MFADIQTMDQMATPSPIKATPSPIKNNSGADVVFLCTL